MRHRPRNWTVISVFFLVGPLWPGSVVVISAQAATLSALVLGDVNKETETGKRRSDGQISVKYWRHGEIRETMPAPGKMCVQLDRCKPSVGLELLATRSRGEEEAVAQVSATDRVRLHGGVLQPLPGTEREATSIAHTIQRAGGKATLLVDEKATITALEAAVAGKRLVHLATHGLTGSTERPYDASLSLTQRGVKAGGSVMALPWGFMYAGAPTVVASLWKVDDRATGSDPVGKPVPRSGWTADRAPPASGCTARLPARHASGIAV